MKKLWLELSAFVALAAIVAAVPRFDAKSIKRASFYRHDDGVFGGNQWGAVVAKQFS